MNQHQTFIKTILISYFYEDIMKFVLETVVADISDTVGGYLLKYDSIDEFGWDLETTKRVFRETIKEQEKDIYAFCESMRLGKYKEILKRINDSSDVIGCHNFKNFIKRYNYLSIEVIDALPFVLREIEYRVISEEFKRWNKEVANKVQNYKTIKGAYNYIKKMSEKHDDYIDNYQVNYPNIISFILSLDLRNRYYQQVENFFIKELEIRCSSFK